MTKEGVQVDIKRRLGDLLVESGMITAEQLEKALNEQRRTGERLGKILTRLGFVREKDILEVLEFQLGIPKVVLEDYQLDSNVVHIVPEALARRYMAIPIKKDGNRLLVAMADPLNLNAIDDLRLATGMEIVPAIASEKEIETAIGRFFEPRIDEAAISALEEIKVDTAASWDTYDLDEPAAGGIDRAPAVQLVNQLLSKAIRAKASDVHIEPQESYVAVRYRIDGLLREVMRLPLGVLNSLVSRIKIMAGMDIAEKRLPQDGRFQITLERRSIDFRVSTMPTVYGEKIVLRILDKANMFLSLDSLGFLPRTLEQYESLIRSSYGMILITGPTGSGKTTTLYATLNTLNTPEKNIITIEDPVEYLLPGINQVRVNPKAGLDFARGLRAILRQDPDIIMVGEIRDRETADIAVRAATTGHLVFSTLHTNDAAGAVTRLLDMGIEPFLVNSSLLGVVAQRLVRLVCPQCRESYEPKPGDIEYEFMDDKRKVFYRGKGCRQCNYTGYQGRTAIHEILVMTDDIRQMVSQKVHVSKIREAAIAGGMVTLRDDGVSKAAQGLTTVQEVLRVTISGF
jgi:type IV pilus assembly protein PilB